MYLLTLSIFVIRSFSYNNLKQLVFLSKFESCIVMVLSQLMKTQVLAGNLNFSCYHIVNKCKQQWSDSTIYFHLQKVRLKIFKLFLLYWNWILSKIWISTKSQILNPKSFNDCDRTKMMSYQRIVLLIQCFFVRAFLLLPQFYIYNDDEQTNIVYKWSW